MVFPALGAYVGGDIVAGMLATGMDRDKRIRLFIDVGTNCEIVLGDGEWILSTAAPAGPAFEGGAIRCGMRAADGRDRGGHAHDAGHAGTRRHRRRRARPGCAGPVSSTPWPNWCAWASSTRPAASCPASGGGAGARRWPDRLTRIGEERVFVLHGSSPGRPANPSTCPSGTCASCSSPRRHRDRLALLLEEVGVEPRDDPAGAAGRLVRQLPVPGVAVRHRSGPEAARAAHGLPGNVAGEGAKMALLSLRERAAGRHCWRR